MTINITHNDVQKETDEFVFGSLKEGTTQNPEFECKWDTEALAPPMRGEGGHVVQKKQGIATSKNVDNMSVTLQRLKPPPPSFISPLRDESGNTFVLQFRQLYVQHFAAVNTLSAISQFADMVWA